MSSPPHPSPIPLGELTRGLGLTLVAGSASTPVTGLADDSRAVEPGNLFFARRGTHGDGGRYIPEAVRAGAAAVLAERPPDGGERSDLAWLVSDAPNQRLLGMLAERFFGSPSLDLLLVGVTGTNGKTTTATLIQHLFRASGLRCGLLGTVHEDDGHTRRPATLTTPGPVALSRALARMRDNGCRAAAVEVSSHALDQGRVDGLRFDGAVVTRVTGDHLDYHGDMSAYVAAKARLPGLVEPGGAAVVHGGNAWAESLAAAAREPVYWAPERGGHQRRPSARIALCESDGAGSRLCLAGPWGTARVRLPLAGRHNAENALQALTAVHALRGGDERLGEALASAPQVPGRLERVSRDDGFGPAVLVDYAHTHDALENVLAAARGFTHGRLWTVVGCGGERDRAKRPKMAAAAQSIADHVVITSDNPRSESPEDIVADMRAGLDPALPAPIVELDRRAAIFRAVGEAEPDDVVIVAGKGHETEQEIDGEKHPFDDRAVAAEALGKTH